MQKIFGRKPVLEALLSGASIEKIYFLSGTKGDIIDKIKIEASNRKIAMLETHHKKFYGLVKTDKSQGVCAITASKKTLELEDLLYSLKDKKKSLIVILDSIQDPRNLGAILRTCECAGVDGVIISKHNSAPLTETVFKTSAGAAEHLSICKVVNINQAVDKLKDSGFVTVGSSLQESFPYDEVDYSDSIALIFGNEEKGIKRLTAQKCDKLIKIPMKGKIQSLNVSVAAGIIIFHAVSQRRKLLL